MGCRKILHLYRQSHPEEAGRIGRDRAFEEFRKRGLLIPKKRGKPRTTQAYHNLPIYRNRIKGLQPSAANQVWVSDLTYIHTRDGLLYLSLVTDSYSRKIQGYHLAGDLKASGCLCALDMALAHLPEGQHPIHHSDRGCQYASHEYVQKLAQRDLQVSMTEVDHCAENALAERMNGILKQEYELDWCFANRAEAQRAVKQAVTRYNEKRPHGALGYQTPSGVHQSSIEATGSSWRPAAPRLAPLASATQAAKN